MHAAPAATHPHGLFTRRDLAAAGISDNQLKRRLRRGEWVRVRRGVYIDATRLGEAEADDARRHRVEAAALMLTTRSGNAVVTGRSAAAIHGFPLLHSMPALVEVTVPRAERGSLAHVHERTTRSPIPAVDITLRAGVRVTGSARTVLDVAMSSSRFEAAVVVDAALRSGEVDRVGLQEAAARAAKAYPRNAFGLVCRLLADGDGGIGHPVLSVVRRSALDAGLPEPDALELRVAGQSNPVPTLRWQGTREVFVLADGDGSARRALSALGARVLVIRPDEVVHAQAWVNAMIRPHLVHSRCAAA
jgi:hypothetical protein